MDYPVIIASMEERIKDRKENPNFGDLIIKSWKRNGNRADIEVERNDNGATFSSMGGWVSSPFWPSPIKAKKGDKIRVWSNGSDISGISLWQENKLIPIFYQTQKEKDAAWGYWVVQHQIKQREEFEKDKARLDALYDELPAPLKKRLDRFREEDPDFRWREESYEMASIAEAARLYKLSLDPEFGKKLKKAKIKGPTEEAKKKSSWDWKETDGIIDWEDTPENRLLAFDAVNSVLNGYNYKLAHEIHPELDEGHSGNTWGFAVMLANKLIQDGDNAQI